MNVYQPRPPSEPEASSHEVDQLLRRFFRAETPASWPRPAVGADPSLSPRSSGLPRGRLALAAAVALLLGGQAVVIRGYQKDDPAASGTGTPAVDVASRPGKKARPADRGRGPDSLKAKDGPPSFSVPPR
jgi:hypothetical protein